MEDEVFFLDEEINKQFNPNSEVRPYVKTDRNKRGLEITHEKQQIEIARKKERILEALEKTLGNVSLTCKSCMISRATFYDYYALDTVFRDAVDEIQEGIIDNVENKLYENINKGDIASTIFFLKTKAKKRGYSEQADIKFDGNISISVVPPKNNQIE